MVWLPFSVTNVYLANQCIADFLVVSVSPLLRVGTKLKIKWYFASWHYIIMELLIAFDKYFATYVILLRHEKGVSFAKLYIYFTQMAYFII